MFLLVSLRTQIPNESVTFPISFVLWNSNPGLRILVDFYYWEMPKSRPFLYVLQTSSMGKNTCQYNSRSSQPYLSRKTTDNELDSSLSEECTGHSVFPWSVRLVTDLSIWCKTKWTFEAIIWTILVKRKLVIGKKVSGGALIIHIEFLYWSHTQDNCLIRHFILLGWTWAKIIESN